MKPLPQLTALTLVGLVPLVGMGQFEAIPESHSTPEIHPNEVLVTFFSEPDFRGEFITVASNTVFEDLDDIRFESGRRVDNRISSILIDGPAEVTLYERDEFEGDFITLTKSEADLHLLRKGRYDDWDNEISSVVVTGVSEEVIGEPGLGGGYPHPPGTVVVVSPLPTPPPVVVAPCPAETFRGHYGYGPRYRLNPSIVRKVEQAYRDVLRRTPDRHGLRTYYFTMIERGWSESRLRKELRRSDEYHQQTIPMVVKKVYR